MILCIDVGNSHFYGGVFANDDVKLRFRLSTKASTSDEYGIFLKSVLRENDLLPSQITHVGIASVVPQLDYSLRAAFIKYFGKEPFFLTVDSQNSLTIKYPNPQEIGADRIANAIAAVSFYQDKPIVIIDFGTATTFCVINEKKEYLGGLILPGLRLARDALATKTAKLMEVEILKAKNLVGSSTIESIQSGIYYGALGACREIIQKIQNEVFPQKEIQKEVIVIGTGGFAYLFEDCNVFSYLIPDLVLFGIKIAMKDNC